ncbi:hypothetical protein [Ralstonia mannitolilytica]|uniref:hypothetical protein n=1 Tax=Ralstonia mannitolilytica TaxID=105219 RepID=UPI000CEE1F03|nr:hypothetical protein [Ralstonia mannitolilytica]
MCLSNEAAAIKLAERDNLVGELVEALEDMTSAMFFRPACQAQLIERCKCHECAIDRARAVIAKAREGAQS